MPWSLTDLRLLLALAVLVLAMLVVLNAMPLGPAEPAFVPSDAAAPAQRATHARSTP